MEDKIEELKQQHFKTYKSAIIETINNNTNVLCDEDITSLLKKPPLDSMDSVKSRFLTLAKKNNIVLNTETLSDLLDEYRANLLQIVKKIKQIRTHELLKKVEEVNDNEAIIKYLKKDFNTVNKKIKKLFKDTMNDCSKKFLSKIDNVFLENTDSVAKDKIVTDITKFIDGNYQRQMLENVDIKILIKDTTLINLIKELTERHLFTLSNSRLFKDNI